MREKERGEGGRKINLAISTTKVQCTVELEFDTVELQEGSLFSNVHWLVVWFGMVMWCGQCPASTVQILGAEKALFRALKSKGNTPKYGLIFHSSFIGRAGTKNKGRVSRYGPCVHMMNVESL